jgi:hypothetical protein
VKNRAYYEKIFASYPDVVTLVEFRKMLGGIGDQSARKIINEGHLRPIRKGNAFLFPKQYVIDYILGPHYAKLGKRLKHHIE